MLPFSDGRLMDAIEGSRVPVLVAIGHTADQPLIQRCAAEDASTPWQAGLVLARQVRQAQDGLLQLQARCERRRMAACHRVEARRKQLADIVDEQREQALNRRAKSWVVWGASVCCLAIAVALSTRHLGLAAIVAGTATVASAAVLVAHWLIRTERRSAQLERSQPVRDLEHERPAGLENLRRMRWSRSAIDTLSDQLLDVISGLEPADQTAEIEELLLPRDRPVDAESRHREIEQIADQEYTSRDLARDGSHRAMNSHGRPECVRPSETRYRETTRLVVGRRTRRPLERMTRRRRAREVSRRGRA